MPDHAQLMKQMRKPACVGSPVWHVTHEQTTWIVAVGNSARSAAGQHNELTNHSVRHCHKRFTHVFNVVALASQVDGAAHPVWSSVL